jgi:hypothetical protein
MVINGILPEGHQMRHKSIGWAILIGCVITVSVAELGIQESPGTAQAAPASAGATNACQVVANQIAEIRRIVMSEEQAGQLKPLAAADALVSQEISIDTSNCPADFRMAEMRLIAAESTLSRDAHMDAAKKGELAVRYLAAIWAHRSPYDYTDKISDERKHDLDTLQSAVLDFDQVAMKYGVK